MTRLRVLVILLLLPVLYIRFAAGRAEPDVPVQARLQGVLAGRLLRVAVLGGEAVPKDLLVQEAATFLDEGLEHRPSDAGLLAQRALVARVTEGRAAAASWAGRGSGPLLEVLQGVYSDPPDPPPGAVEVLWAELSGFYRLQALRDLGAASPDLERAEREVAQADLRALAVVALLTGGNLAMGVLVLLLWPLWRRWRGPAGPAFAARWDPDAAVAAVVAFQYLGLLVAIPLSKVLHALGVPAVPMMVLVQVALYALGLGLLLRALPWIVDSGGGLGLGRFRPGHLLQGLAGFWAAIPLVLLGSFLTAGLLGRSPFSSNPALQMLMDASPGELAMLSLVVVFAGPFFEEVLFRGVLYPGLRGGLGVLGAALASGLLFSLVHADPQAVLVLAVLGAVFALLYERTGSLWPSVVAHALWNGTTTLIVVLILGR